MVEIPGFWDVGPHSPLPVEETLQQFVRSFGGKVVAELLPHSPGFDNADYLFESEHVVAELKEVETEFSSTPAFRRGHEKLLSRLVEEEPTWRPLLFGGDGKYPQWFIREFIRLARPPLARIVKKANRQIKETKAHFGINAQTGILLFVNDGFTQLEPDFIHGLLCDLLVHSYSSIDCAIYMTVNRYVEIKGSNTPRLMWHPTYSDRAADSLVDFVNTLGRSWFDFLEERIGPFTMREEVPQERRILDGSRSIVLPGEKR